VALATEELIATKNIVNLWVLDTKGTQIYRQPMKFIQLDLLSLLYHHHVKAIVGIKSTA
jgi:hypothetical protein